VEKAVKVIFKALLWTLLGAVSLVALVVLLLYLPPVQDALVPQVLKMINKPGEMEISVRKFRLSFPLDLAVDSLDFRTPAMEVKTARATLGVAVTPLFTGEIVAEEARLDKTDFRLGTPDSAFYMNARVELASLDGARVHLASQNVRVSSLAIDSGKVDMAIRPDTVPKPVTNDSIPVNWHIILDRGQMKRIDYDMTIEPTITDLNCYLAQGDIIGADVDMRYNTVKVKEVKMTGADARYIYPTPEYLAAHPVPPVEPDTVPTVPWTVTCDKISLSESKGLYAMNGYKPIGDNFDLSYIQASEIDIQIDSFLNRATTVHAPIRRIYTRERCGVPLELKGLFDMDSISLNAKGMTLTTPTSTVTLTAMMGLPPSDDSADGSGNKKQAAALPPDLPFLVDLNAEISSDDMRRLVPAPFAPMVAGLPRGVPLYLRADASGTMADIDAREISLTLPRHLSVAASGRLRDVTDLQKAVGNLEIKGAMPDGSFLKPTLMDARLARQVNLPPMTIRGGVDLDRGDIAGDLTVTAADGSVALDGEWHNRVKGYMLSLDARKFPIQSIMPSLGVSDLTATIDLQGEGLDPFSPATDLAAKVDLAHVGYQGRGYDNITADLNVRDGNASLSATSANRAAAFTLKADGNLAGDTLRWRFDGDVRNIDLRALHLSDSVAEGSVAMTGEAAFTLPKTRVTRVGRRKVTTTTPMSLDADLDISHLYWRMPGGTINASGILAKVATDSARTRLDLDNGDLALRAFIPAGIDTIMARVTAATAILDRSMQRRQLAVDSLQEALPPFTLDLLAGENNILSSYLLDSDISFDSISVKAANDSLLTASAMLDGFKTGETRLDSINLNIRQRDNLLLYNLRVNNRPGTFDQFAHIDAKGFIGMDKFALLFNQKNIQDETGFSFGSVVTMPSADTFSLRFVPYHPIIGYKDWEINRDNFISYNIKTGHIDANIDLKGEASSLKLFTEHSDADSTQEAIRLQITDLKLQDWLAINPFAPPVKGDLSADLSVTYGKQFLDGSGTVSLADLYYGREKVGDFDLDLDLSTNASGTIRATTSLMVDGVKTITASGNLNDSTAVNPFMLDFKMIHFPLSVVNPFLPQGTARLHGMLNGEMDITGKMSEPLFNGWVQFDSTAVDMTMLGSSFVFSEERIPVKDNLVTFDDFAIKAVNENPLTITGTADISSLADIKVDLALAASNTQLVGSKRKKGQDVYGKAYIDLDAKVRGSMARFLDVQAKLKILPGTNVTYVIPDVQSAIASRSNAEMVKFVNFADTAAVAAADSLGRQGMALNLNASLEISQGSTIAVDLSTDGKNRAQVQASGRVNYSLDYLGDERVTGRIDLNQGFVRYSMPPVLSEKLFNIREGSYIIFNGQMLNPTLNLHAYDEIKANVNTDGNSRMATFDVGLSVTGTLENMNVAFDLSTPDDLTVQNELQAMSPDQRANQAMNLLLYGSYTGPGTKASTMGNPLYTFLESQLNNIASSAIKGVDISFGIDQLDRTRDGVNSTAMSYSYRVSKSLFDDRFKIVVGGNYTTDADADENFAQNLIADISFEYMLNKTGTMYVKLFRHTGYESILEGEITQTGVGFVYKKKLRSLKDLFNWIIPRRKEVVAQ